jgi:hypothetical protein
MGVCLAINDCAFAGLVDGPAGSKAHPPNGVVAKALASLLNAT